MELGLKCLSIYHKTKKCCFQIFFLLFTVKPYIIEFLACNREMYKL